MCGVWKRNEVKKEEIGTIFYVVKNFSNIEVEKVKVNFWWTNKNLLWQKF